jgi:hypothetical protein
MSRVRLRMAKKIDNDAKNKEVKAAKLFILIIIQVINS